MTNRFDEQAAQWDSEPRRIQLAQAVGEAIRSHVSLNDQQVLMDFGTGTGLVALKLSPFVKKIIAVDNSIGMHDVLRQKLEQTGITSIEPRLWRIEQGTADLPPLDVIVSSMALHHVPDTSATACTFYQLLNPGGQLAIADLDEENGEFHGDPRATAHNGFNRNAFQKIFEQAGFRDMRFYEAHTMIKPIADGSARPFTIFLMTGKK